VARAAARYSDDSSDDSVSKSALELENERLKALVTHGRIAMNVFVSQLAMLSLI
jgi:hypothetical protein